MSASSPATAAAEGCVGVSALRTTGSPRTKNACPTGPVSTTPTTTRTRPSSARLQGKGLGEGGRERERWRCPIHKAMSDGIYR